MSVTILLSPSLSRLFLFQAGFSFYQVSRQGCFRGSGVCFGDRLCSALFKSTGICFCRCEMYSGGTILTAWKAILFWWWYGGDRFWIVVFSLLSFSNQAFLIQPDSVVRVCAIWGCGTGPSWARSSAERLFWVELCRVLEFSKSQTEWNLFQRDSKVFSSNFRSAAHEFLLLFLKNKFANRERDRARRKFLHRGPA